jgi:hypothetical protein
VSAKARRLRTCLALGFVVFTMPVTALAQTREPSGSELRETYPLHDGAPPEADRDAMRAPAGAQGSAAPASAPSSSGGSTVPIAIAAGLVLLAFAAGFGIPVARPRSRAAGREAGDVGDAGSKPSQSRRFRPTSRSGDRSKPTAPRT